VLKQYEELAVLEQGDDGAIVSIHGQGAPSVVLGAEYLEHLEHIVGQANEELTSHPAFKAAPALRLVCSELVTLIATYRETCNKYGHEFNPGKSLALAIEELNVLRRELEKFSR
jgi:hypothetical protein